jgi:hypothetical protein
MLIIYIKYTSQIKAKNIYSIIFMSIIKDFYKIILFQLCNFIKYFILLKNNWFIEKIIEAN